MGGRGKGMCGERGSCVGIDEKSILIMMEDDFLARINYLVWGFLFE